MSDYAALHTHSEFSLRGGCLRIGEYLDRLEELDVDAAGLLDTHNMFGAFKFHQRALARGIKPVLGTELIVGSDRPGRSGRRSFPRLRVLVENQTGYENLSRLLSESYRLRPDRGLFVERGKLARNWEGLFVLGPESPGPGAPPYDLSAPDFAEVVEADKERYGDRYYVEIPVYGPLTTRQREYVRRAESAGAEVVFTHPAYFSRPTDSEQLRLRLAVQTNSELEELGELPPHREDQYLVGAKQMHQWLGEESHRLENTENLARSCYFEFRTDRVRLPSYPGVEAESSAEYLRQICEEAVAQKELAADDSRLDERLEHELEVINSRDFSDYFLIVADIVNWARENEIAVGPGRGSAAGSLVAYLLGITEVDPFEHDLIFERFLNYERAEMPDVDLDFADRRRGEVIDYIRQRFGEASVAQIITFGRLKARNSLRDVGRVRGEPTSRIDHLLDLFPRSADQQLSGLPGRFEGLESAIDSDPELAEWYEQAQKIEGLARNASIHAAGLLVAEGELDREIPLFRQSDGGAPASQFDMYDVEELGYLKLDILGLSTLTLIELTLEKLPESEAVDVSQLPDSDPEVSELLCSRSLEGVFQFETPGCRELVRRLQPETRSDLMDCLALYRPGPLQSGIVESYLERRHGEAEVEYPHPDLEPILEDTYGLIIYQEQVMAIARKIAGFSWARADSLRKAMGKKKPELMTELRTEFMEGAGSNGYGRELAEDLFETLSNFAEYGFNRSHSAAYAKITYRTAYLKAHYPRCFYAALCTVKSNDRNRIGRIAGAMEEDGYELLPPRVNESRAEFTVEAGDVRYGLAAVKHVGGNLARAITSVASDQEFEDLDDFLSRVPPEKLSARAFQALAGAGYFDPFLDARGLLVEHAGELVQRGADAFRDREQGQENLFEARSDPLAGVGGSEGGTWSYQKRIRARREALGYYPDGHPLENFESLFSFLTPGRVADHVESELSAGEVVAPPQLIAFCEDKYERNGRRYLRLIGEKEELVLETTGELPEVRRRVLLCRLDFRGEWKVAGVERLNTGVSPGLEIHLTHHQKIEQLERIREILKTFQGSAPVQLFYHDEELVRLSLRNGVELEPGLARELNNLLGPGHTSLYLPDSNDD